jgi:polysaccharide export outer membrane protein
MKFPSQILLVLFLVVSAGGVATGQRMSDTTVTQAHLISAQDVLTVTVLNQASLTGKYTVQPDGSIRLPLVGRIVSAGMTVAEFESRLTRALADGFLLEPRVTVELEQFNGRRVFVFGNIVAPGTYALTDQLTLIEVLAKAGYGAASEAVIVRPNKAGAGATLPDQVSDGEVIRVSLRELEKAVEQGSLARNVVLKDGDTIFVPRVDLTRVFVSGKVRTPGAYPITEGTTVLQALSLAGGVTEEAAVNRITILRLVKGEQKSIKAKLSDVLQAGDTLVVPERYF